MLLDPLVLRFVKCDFQVLRGLVEACPDIFPGSFVLPLSHADPGFQFSERTLSCIDGCFDFVSQIGLQQSGLDVKSLKPLFRLQQAFFKTTLEFGALLAMGPPAKLNNVIGNPETGDTLSMQARHRYDTYCRWSPLSLEADR